MEILFTPKVFASNLQSGSCRINVFLYLILLEMYDPRGMCKKLEENALQQMK